MPLLEAAALEVAGDVAGALFLYRRCGALYDVRRLESDASHPSQSDALTAREREVAILAAAGHANNEIARALSITPKTIEKHLASVYRKLDITSRAKLGSHFAVYAESQK